MSEEKWAGRSMLIKYDHLNPQQFTTLAAFLESAANIVAAPTGRMCFDFDRSVEGAQLQTSLHRFARLVKAEQKAAPARGTSVAIEVMVMLLLVTNDEYYAVPFMHWEKLIEALGLFPRVAESVP